MKKTMLYSGFLSILTTAICAQAHSEASTTPSTVPTAVVAPPIQTIDCHYAIPTSTLHIDAPIISEWSEKATRQSFTLDHTHLTAQLAALKSCFTNQGWQSFNDALQKSGNINAIEKQQLTVSSIVDGKSTTTDVKDNQWKVSVPLQVIYQNDKEKLTQRLTVDLIVGRKPSGDLGIMQMIASPQQTQTPTTNTTKS